MKKRKFPIVPVSLLVILVGGAVAYSFKPFDSQPEGPNLDDHSVTGESRKSGDTKDLAKIAREQAGSSKIKRGPEDPTESNEPAILLPDIPDYKPVPNPTSTSAHWYDEQSVNSKN